MMAAHAIHDDRATLIVEHFPLVRLLARRVRGMVPGSDTDELIGDGCIGLIRAVDTYDEKRGASLERYIRRVVIGSMLNGLRKRDPVSERARRTIREAERERFFLAQERGEMPAMSEMETRRKDLRRANIAVLSHTPLSLDAPLPPGTCYAARGDDPAEIVAARLATLELDIAVAALPVRERRVVALHYEGEEALRNIGSAMRVSPQRASQLHLAALRRLRKAIVR